MIFWIKLGNEFKFMVKMEIIEIIRIMFLLKGYYIFIIFVKVYFVY